MIVIGNSQKKDNNFQIKLDTIEYGRSRIRTIEEITGEKPVYLIEAVEAMQNEYDNQAEYFIYNPNSVICETNKKDEGLDVVAIYLHEVKSKENTKYSNRHKLIINIFKERLKKTYSNLLSNHIFSSRSRQADSTYNRSNVIKTEVTVVLRKTMNILLSLDRMKYEPSVIYIKNLIMKYEILINKYPNKEVYKENLLLLIEAVEEYEKLKTRKNKVRKYKIEKFEKALKKYRKV